MTLTLNTKDQKEREKALDPTQSFIVQAPAGSGKTELLTQRFLRLLETVKKPEEILAITFTKKSAAEMRSRILHALQTAHATPEPLAPHAKKTWRLAKKALEKNNALEWELLDNPHRLQIQTIDSLNAALTRHLPLLSRIGAALTLSDQPDSLYQHAITDLFSHLEAAAEGSPLLARLLEHLDNNVSLFEKLLIEMLKKRDQWLPHLTTHEKPEGLRQRLEASLQSIQKETLTRLKGQLTENEASELIHLASYAATHLQSDNLSSPLIACLHLTTLPSCDASGLPAWQGLAALLLTDKKTWRKTADRRIGFPTDKKNTLFKRYKERFLLFVDTLKGKEELKKLLSELDELPEAVYSDDQWQVLNALYPILKIAAAQLKVTFQQEGQMDYIENAEAALQALGTDEHPTDLALALDYRIQHILIDEFQDTSRSQFRLIEKLILGWQPNEGRTLFVVGDPMQSIYRFREADVGLFIRAREKGIHHFPLTPLTLSVNFRSTPGIVQWVNQCFKILFPSHDNLAEGAVSYSPSVSNQENISADTEAVTLHPLTSPDEEPQKIVTLIQTRKKENPTEKIAILVRSRSHLNDIIPALQKANLPYRAIAIDTLDKRPLIQDLLALTRALLFLEDRIAWLSVLRAPWCGLSLHDLHALAREKKTILWKQLHSKKVLSTVSPEGIQRLQKICPLLSAQLESRERYPLREWVEETWLLLSGPACLSSETDLEDARAYFGMLETLEQEPLTAELLHKNVEKLFAAPQSESDAHLQIMTIHNAKGLEFDTVILPKLNSKATQDDYLLLEWLEQLDAEDSTSLLLAPIKAIGSLSDKTYQYIRKTRLAKIDLERVRLLYVAATRAKQKLELFFPHENPNTGSLLEKLWPAIQSDLREIKNLSENLPHGPMPLKKKKSFIRLPLHFNYPYQKPSLPTLYENQQYTFQLKNPFPQHVGIVTHRLLQDIAESKIRWKEIPSAEQDTFVAAQLIQSGLPSPHLKSAISHVKKAIQTTLEDPRGQWILRPHAEAKNEWSLTALVGPHVKTWVIDRTFVDENQIRWIVDYKITDYAGENLSDFLRSEKRVYHHQLKEYADALRLLDKRPIRVGLYFPLVPSWIEWEP